jgi:hypothetical protein
VAATKSAPPAAVKAPNTRFAATKMREKMFIGVALTYQALSNVELERPPAARYWAPRAHNCLALAALPGSLSRPLQALVMRHDGPMDG